MKRYAVSWMNFVDRDLKICEVYAANPIEAMIDGVRILMGSTFYTEAAEVDPWLEGLLEKMTPPEDYETRIEEIQEEFFNVGQLVSKPLLIVEDYVRG